MICLFVGFQAEKVEQASMAWLGAIFLLTNDECMNGLIGEIFVIF